MNPATKPGQQSPLLNGFQRLVLLGSAGYRRAELPLDDSVSLIAPNNTGKTSLINALQFLLIIDKRRMDFGAHEFDKTRRFYFPNNSAYILLEVSLPQTGAVVLGCVGKGVSHDYEYFAYQGTLKAEDFRLPNDSLVSQPQLHEHLAGKGYSVFSYTPSEFAEVLYGGRRRRHSGEPDFTVFRLENAADAQAYRRVLTRTLRLDKLTSQDVKGYLLQIFSRDLPDASIDFKQEWDKAFSEVNADRAQLQAAQNQLTSIRQLEQMQEERLTLRGKIIDWRPRIDQGLHDWEAHFQTLDADLELEYDSLSTQQKQLMQRERELEGERRDLQQEDRTLREQTERRQTLYDRFALVQERSQLEAQHRQAQIAYEQQVTLVSQAGNRSTRAIERELQQAERERTGTERAQATQSDNLYRRLAAQLDEPALARLNKALNSSTMTLAPNQFELDANALKQWLTTSPDDRLPLPGLDLSLQDLTPGHQQRSEQELHERLEELLAQIDDLQQQLETARTLEAAEEKKHRLAREVRQREQDLVDYDELAQLTAAQPQRDQRRIDITEALAEVNAAQAGSEAHAEKLRNRLEETRTRQQRLQEQHRIIERLRNQRHDTSDAFTYLDQQRHHPWLGEREWTLDGLADRLQIYQQDCQTLMQLQNQLQHRLTELHSGGLTKYQYSDDAESEIHRIIEFSHQLDKEAEAVEKKARSAVVNVTASLRELRDGLRSFKSRMNEFNRLIGRRQLSDLRVFKITPEDETHLVEAIELLIATAEKVNSGDTFELFNQASVLDDTDLDRARQTLIDEGNARQGLKVADLFRLTFVVGKVDSEAESFDDIDSAASNGTVLMAKLVTGLAMLHLMQDKRPNNVVRKLCYLDEALALDARNQTSLIDTAADFGFALVFASPAPLVTARYCVPIQHHEGWNHISRQSWQILEPLNEGGTA